jgi:hypothetical protein
MSRPQYPDWPELATTICSACGLDIERLPEEVRRDPSQLVEHAIRQSPTSYQQVLKETFAAQAPTERQIWLSRIPFKAFITTNYDSLIRRSLESSIEKDIRYYPYPHLPVHAITDPSVKCVFHIHGCVDPEASTQRIVLSASEYDNAYKTSLLKSFLVQAFAYSPVCFVGCRLADDERIREVFRFCRTVRKELQVISPNASPPWSILMDRDEVAKTEVNWDDHGIHVVTFDKIDNNYSGLDPILRTWAGVREARKAVPFDDPYNVKQEPTR